MSAEGKGYFDMDLLRFTTAGSVDDGKSTLIGRLLFDSKAVMEDQLEALQRSADLTGGDDVNLANLTDGLRSEREQGITIDVAYRYFATKRRKFIIADTPGHKQYTRNMVTGASTANLAIILVDARHGVVEQTRRHAYIASLLKIPHVVFCINKMDLVDYSEERYEEIKDACLAFVPKLGLHDVTYIPISALKGDNVVDKSEVTAWYGGPSLLTHLESVYIASDVNLEQFRMPVQWIVRPHKDEFHDFRGFAGQIAGGTIEVGDEVVVQPSGMRSKVKEIWTYDGCLKEAFAPQSVTIRLEDEIDISRGDMLVGSDVAPFITKEHEADINWMHESALQPRRKYLLKHNTNSVACMVTEVRHKLDIDSLEEVEGEEAVKVSLNDIARIEFKTVKPLVYDAYRRNRQTGAFVLIDEATNATVAAGMLLPPTNYAPPQPVDMDYAI
ncbi:MAG: GTP-binding protein [Verrucomicrobiales bacterium]|nr:GTP-binding protein [Verrucomicrobiales bacterium]